MQSPNGWNHIFIYLHETHLCKASWNTPQTVIVFHQFLSNNNVFCSAPIRNECCLVISNHISKAWSKSISKNLSSALVYRVAARCRPKVPIFEGFGTLGTKVVMVELELTSLGSLPVLKKDNTALVCYDPRWYSG